MKFRWLKKENLIKLLTLVSRSKTQPQQIPSYLQELQLSQYFWYCFCSDQHLKISNSIDIIFCILIYFIIYVSLIFSFPCLSSIFTFPCLSSIFTFPCLSSIFTVKFYLTTKHILNMNLQNSCLQLKIIVNSSCNTFLLLIHNLLCSIKIIRPPNSY